VARPFVRIGGWRYLSAMSETNDSPRIGEDEVRHVARLSRLQLSDEQLARFTGQLGQIIDYVNKLNELDVAEVEPLTTAIDMTNVLRDDAEAAGLSNDQALANAPDQSPPYFKVPKVLE
jgi:aspartyl-tRNA(Asn)/glutamyl-tRNA(Gln) amidotransferase subunit C